MTVKLLTKRHLQFLILKGGCTGSSETTDLKMPHGWKSHVTAHMPFSFCRLFYNLANSADTDDMLHNAKFHLTASSIPV